MTDFFKIEVATTLWGDYGVILAHGVWGQNRFNEYGVLDLSKPLKGMRTGPFVPDLTLNSQNLVIPDRSRRLLEELGATKFSPADLEKAGWIPWHEWGLLAPEPKKYPPGGEPFNYLDRLPDSDKAREAIGDIWEVMFETTAEFSSTKIGVRSWRRNIRVDSWNGADVFQAYNPNTQSRGFFATAKGRSVIEQQMDVEKFISFKEAGVF
ncbi:MAG: hypothetical protein KDA87_14465 [Planctomycetales bacterium]|nr:hypothetical protein [Planctomycetales bacterium]